MSQSTEAPRLTLADVEANISSEFYFTAADGIEGARIAHGVYLAVRHDDQRADIATGQVTFCMLILRNGTKLVGINYGAIDPAQHSVERGRELARADAIRQVWPLMGYELRSKLAAQPSTYQDRVRAEADELEARWQALNRFIAGDTFGTLPMDERLDMHAQAQAMSTHLIQLQRRIYRFGKQGGAA